MKCEKTLVMGSGISALAYLFYHQDAFALAGEQVGGLFSQAQSMGPQYIWKTASTTKFLTDMGYINERVSEGALTRTVRIGYLWEGKVHRLSDLAIPDRVELQRKYSMKTRGTAPASSHMSDGKSEFEIYSIPVEQLVSDLLTRVVLRLSPIKADAVDLYSRTVQSGTRFFEYDTLVSTVPAPVFLRMIGKGDQTHHLKAFDKVYEKDDVHFEFEKELLLSNSNGSPAFDYVYVPGDEHEFHRVRFLPEGKVVREVTFNSPTYTYDGGGLKHKAGQIVGGHEILSSLPPSVELYGRYSVWQHGIRLEDVLEAIQ